MDDINKIIKEAEQKIGQTANENPQAIIGSLALELHLARLNARCWQQRAAQYKKAFEDVTAEEVEIKHAEAA